MKFVHHTVFRGTATWLDETTNQSFCALVVKRAIFRHDFSSCKVQFDSAAKDYGWPTEIDLRWSDFEQAYEAHFFPHACKLRIKKIPNLKVLDGHWYSVLSALKSEPLGVSDDIHRFAVREFWKHSTVGYRLIFDMHEYSFESEEVEKEAQPGVSASVRN